MQTCPLAHTPYTVIADQRYNLSWPLVEGAPACAPETPCPACGEHDAAAYEREANLVIVFSPGEGVGLDAETCCVHCGETWPIELDMLEPSPIEPADLAA